MSGVADHPGWIRGSRVVTRVAVVGAGVWGHNPRFSAEHSCLHGLVGEGTRSRRVDRGCEERTSSSCTPGVVLPTSLRVTGDLPAAVEGAELVGCAPGEHPRSLVESIDVAAPLVVNVAKGLEEGTCMRMSEVLADAQPRRDPAQRSAF